MTAAFWLVLIAAISDAIDGAIAKKFNMTTVLGGYLDPIADKALLVCSYIALGDQGYLPMWLVIGVVFRDIVIIGGALSYHMMNHTLIMTPIMISKINTVMQLILAITILASEGLGFEVDVFREIMIVLVAITTAFSGATYVAIWSKKAMSDNEYDADRNEE